MNWYRIIQSSKMSPKESFIQMTKDLQLFSWDHPFYFMGVRTSDGQEHSISLELKLSPNGWRLSYIQVPEESRRKGLASYVISRISELADKYGQELTLGVKADEGSGLNNDQLTEFYSRYGFESDQGSDTEMVRLPNLEASRKLPTIGYRDLSKFMRSLGFEHVSTKGDHQKWRQINTGQMVTILDPSAWGSNSKNILEYILNNMGIASKDFAKLWRSKQFRKNPSTHIDPNLFDPGADRQNLMKEQIE